MPKSWLMLIARVPTFQQKFEKLGGASCVPSVWQFVISWGRLQELEQVALKLEQQGL